MKYLIVGLGNVGAEYEGTRHNAGFMVVDELVKETNRKLVEQGREKEKVVFVLERHAYRAEVRCKGRTLVLIRPTTYMNLSGKAVKYWMDKEKVELANVLVVVDDLALPVGKIRMKKQGSHGGHNGLTDIEEKLGTNNYCRLRIGIGSDFSRGHQIDYVLGAFSEEERALLDPAIVKAAEAVKCFATQGADRAMNMYN
ncbi:MAG: aminoacyl-tRNA hydrolase [Bacteroidales bacterium]|nr:aminoacyl-tRNA hydrolase [Bacteroidales bacterium]